MDKQRTLQKEVVVRGVGLHTAHEVTVTLKPAPVDTGIQFVRMDLAERPVVRVNVDALVSPARSRRTSLGTDTVEIQTVEHLMAVLTGLAVDNVIIEVDADELPGLDGSSVNFMEAVIKAGIVEQDKERQYFYLKEPLCVEEENASIIALPCRDFKVSYTLQYDHPFLRSQFLELVITPEAFQKELAPARTFCLEEEVELKRQGFGHGATYDNTLVVGKQGVVKNELRFQDEFVRHKILDLLGDLSLIGRPVKCHIIALKSGHALNLKIARKISQQIKRSTTAGVGTQRHVPDLQVLDVNEIMKILPHREPFLFVDRIIKLEKGKHAVGVKNVTINDYFFRGHFPGKPVMPGVIIVEALAQVGGVMMLSLEEHRGKLAYFMGINNVKFRKVVVPGDELILDVTVVKMKSRIGQVYAKALVQDKVVAEAELMFALASD